MEETSSLDDGPTQDPISASLGLVSDANSIRENIVDEFTCEVNNAVMWKISAFYYNFASSTVNAKSSEDIYLEEANEYQLEIEIR